MRNIEIRFVVGLQHTLLAGACVQFSARIFFFLQARAVKGLIRDRNPAVIAHVQLCIRPRVRPLAPNEERCILALLAYYTVSVMLAAELVRRVV